ncbi:MAG TPA: NUDIX hydrolase [Candidatus Saccharimonadales bacterium]
MKKLIPADAVLLPDNAERAFAGEIFDVYQWQQKLYDGSSTTFEMLKRPDTVTAICMIKDKILIADDEQPHLGMRQSFPGGRVDASDPDVNAAVQREVNEETGYCFKSWRLIKVSQPYRKMEWFVYVWLAWDVSGQEEPDLDPGEKIKIRGLEFAAVKKLVLEREGYLGESIDLFEGVDSIDQLLALPEFKGQEVDR